MREKFFGTFLLICGLTLAFSAAVVDRRAEASRATDAISVGAGVRFICQTAAPSPSGRARLWVRCSDGSLMYTTATNTDYAVKP